MLQQLIRVRLDPGNGVEGAFDVSDVSVSEYYPGAPCVPCLLY